ncbi:MAG: aldehyde dehydrogenase family protein [Marmoricola sp.]
MSQTDITTPSPSATFGTTEASAVVARLRATFSSGRTRSLRWRQEQLDGLMRLLSEREGELVSALAADLGRTPFEAWAADLRTTAREVEDLRRHLGSWMAPEKRRVPMLFRPGRAEVVPEPLGAVLVIAPWNYPIQLLLTPVAAALAAGNAVLAKPSEVAPATSAAMAELLPLYLDPDAVAVVEGGVAETTALLEQRWDHIFYTGNGTVGRIVAAAAAAHLTPVTLELGGKSPVIITRDANLKLAASRVAFSKFLNAGQTCVASDHVWVHRDVERRFLDALTTEVARRYGQDPRTSKDYGRIVNTGHARRISRLLDGQGYEVALGGQVDIEARYVAPTVLRAVKREAAVMGEEIFGPVLPVLVFDDLDEVTDAINAGDKPLALYIFTDSEETVAQVVAETSSGGVCVNDAVTHLLVSSLPFGGVGESGYGSYHGRAGFDTFSHHKAIYHRPSWFVDPPLLNAPYPKWKRRLARWIF